MKKIKLSISHQKCNEWSEVSHLRHFQLEHVVPCIEVTRVSLVLRLRHEGRVLLQETAPVQTAEEVQLLQAAQLDPPVRVLLEERPDGVHRRPREALLALGPLEAAGEDVLEDLGGGGKVTV